VGRTRLPQRARFFEVNIPFQSAGMGGGSAGGEADRTSPDPQFFEMIPRNPGEQYEY
jgi:hypothetical protein